MAEATEEASAIQDFQIDQPDVSDHGGFWFGRKQGQLLPFINPVSTAFCLQAYQWWLDFQAGQFASTGHHLSRQVKVAFASCLRDHIPAFLDRFSEISPESDLWVVSEFQPPRGRWIPYRIDRSPRENLTALRAALGDRAIQFVALSLQPNSPYGAMRRMALRIAPLTHASLQREP